MRRPLLILLWVLTAAGQEAPVMPLSLRKAVEIAVAPEGNTRIEIAQEVIAQAEARKAQARSALLPNIDGSVSYQDITRNLRAFGIQVPSVPGIPFSFPSFAGPFGVFDARASANQSVFDLSSIRRYQSSKAGVEVARREKESTRTLVTDQVARAYLSALRAESNLETARANVQLAEALRELAESQKRAGTGTGIEVTRADVQLANEKQRLLVAENDRSRAHLLLLRALDLRLDTRLELTDRLAYQIVEPISYDQAVAAAVSARPDWKAQQEKEHLNQLNYSAVRSERLPSVAAFADYGSIGTEIGDSRATRGVGIALRFPVFDGGRRDARRAESMSLLRQEQIRSRDLRRQMELEIRLAFDTLQSADLQVRTAEEGMKLAERELEQAQRRYKAGVTNSLEVTDAQTRVARARRNRTDALFQHNLARLDLGTAIGAVDRFLP
ncbi:MAG: TolC family protein [Bryobacteraceae bacterium]|nr:TolC family protein [Bryobacteraceae bacterium]